MNYYKSKLKQFESTANSSGIYEYVYIEDLSIQALFKLKRMGQNLAKKCIFCLLNLAKADLILKEG